MILKSFWRFLFGLESRESFVFLLVFLMFVACALFCDRNLVALRDFCDFFFAGFLDFKSWRGKCFLVFVALVQKRFCLFHSSFFYLVFVFFHEKVMIKLFRMALFHLGVLFIFPNLFLLMIVLIFVGLNSIFLFP